MNMNKPDHKPGDDREILIVFDSDNSNQFTTGFYDYNEVEYFTYDGELIEMHDMVAWDEKPTVEFL